MKEKKLLNKFNEKLSNKNSFNTLKNKIDYNINKKNKLTFSIVSITSSLAVIALVAIIVISSINRKNDLNMLDGKYIISTNTSIKNEESSYIEQHSYYVKRWDERTNLEKWNSYHLNEIHYNVYSNQSTKDIYIGNKIGKVVAKGYDIYEEKSYETEVDAYEIKKVDTNLAIAIKFENDDKFYSVLNCFYQFDTIKDMVEACNLKEYASFGTLSYFYISNNKAYNVYFDNIDNNLIYDTFFKDESLEIKQKNYDSEYYGMSFTIEALGRFNLSLSFDKQGYARTNIFSNGRVWYIGQKGFDFFDYINNNYQGYIYEY